MKLSFLLAIITLVSTSTAWRTPSDKEDVELVENVKVNATGRLAIPPPLGNMPPNRQGPVASAIVNPMAAPIVNQGIPGLPGPGLLGPGSSSFFFAPVRISVDQSSQLFVPPGSDGRITVNLQNDGVGDNFIISGGDDRGFFLQFDYNIVPLGPGQTIAVSGRIRVPPFANNVVSTLNIIVQRRSDNAISRRQVLIRTRSEPGERWGPWCTIRTVTRCDHFLDESVCAQRFWNMRAEIQDTEAGLLSISIKPDGRFLGEDFPVGTNDSVAVEQSVSCCTTGVDITAIDVRGNTVTCRADQYGIYLGAGDVAAIILGILLLILLIILIIFAVCRCCRRRKKISTAPIPRSKKDQA